MPKGHAKAGHRGLRRGSITSRLVALVLAETTALKRSLTFLETTQWYQARYGDHPRVSRLLHEAVARGLLLAAYVLPRVGYVCHPTAPFTLVPRDAPAVVALRFVKAVWRRYGRPSTTREITKAIRRRDATVRTRAVTAMLEQMATPRRWSYGVVPTQVLRREDTVSSIGEPQRLWYPVGVETSCPVPASLTEGMRMIVRESSAALGGWPVSATEMSLWCDAHPDEHIGQMYGEPLRRARRFLGQRLDAEHAGEANRLHGIRTVFTCAGGLQQRFRVGPPGPLDHARATIIDMATSLRPATEFRGIVDLRERSVRLRLPAYAMLASAREYLLLTVVGNRLREAWPTSGAPLTTDWIATEVQGARQAVLTIRAWAQGAAARSGAPGWRGRRRLRRFGALLDQLEGLDTVAQHVALPARLTQSSPIPPVIGEAALVAIDDLRPYLEAVGRVLRHAVGDYQSRHVLVRARRLPFVGPQPTWLRTHRDAAVDRVDAMLEIFSVFPMPQTAGLLGDARVVLGEVLRDTRTCYQFLEELPEMMHELRGSVVLALALLGELVDESVALLDPRDVHAVTAYVLAGRLVLADDIAYDAWLRRLMALVPNRGGKEVVDHARQRLEQGASISVVD